MTKGDTPARRTELGTFLRARRAQLRQADVGLPARDRATRRTPGLSREEVAQISGVGVTWYTRLEQGRDVAPSLQVLDALARALLLDPAGRRYLRTLAGFTTPAAATPVDDPRPRLQRLVDAALPTIASVYDVHLDYLVWNTAYERIRHDPATLPDDRRNLLWMLFADPASQVRMLQWESAARAVLGQFRAAAGQHPADPRFAVLVSALAEASDEFRTWWSEYPLREFRPATIGIEHPTIGGIDLEMFQLRPVEHPDLLLVLQVPQGDEALLRVRSLLC